MSLTASNQNLVRPVFVPQLRSVTLPRLELDGNLSVVEQVGPLEDNAEAALADLLADAVVHADNIAAAGSHCELWCEAGRVKALGKGGRRPVAGRQRNNTGGVGWPGRLGEKGAGRGLPPLLWCWRTEDDVLAWTGTLGGAVTAGKVGGRRWSGGRVK